MSSPRNRISATRLEGESHLSVWKFYCEISRNMLLVLCSKLPLLLSDYELKDMFNLHAENEDIPGSYCKCMRVSAQGAVFACIGGFGPTCTGRQPGPSQ